MPLPALPELLLLHTPVTACPRSMTVLLEITSAPSEPSLGMLIWAHTGSPMTAMHKAAITPIILVIFIRVDSFHGLTISDCRNHTAARNLGLAFREQSQQLFLLAA